MSSVVMARRLVRIVWVVVRFGLGNSVMGRIAEMSQVVEGEFRVLRPERLH